MINATDKVRSDLMRLWSALTALRQLEGNAAKGKFLLAAFEKDNRLARYFAAVYDAGLVFPYTAQEITHTAVIVRKTDEVCTPLALIRWMTSEPIPDIGEVANAWARVLFTLSAEDAPELRDISHRILERDLRCGVTAKLLNKVFARLEMPLITEPPPEQPTEADPEVGLTVVVTCMGMDGTGTAYMAHDGRRAASLVLYNGPGLGAAIRALRAAGVLVVVPPNMKEVVQ